MTGHGVRQQLMKWGKQYMEGGATALQSVVTVQGLPSIFEMFKMEALNAVMSVCLILKRLR